MFETLAYYSSALRRDFSLFCSEKLQEMGLSEGLLYFIVYIGKHKGCSPGEVAKNIHQDTGYTTRSIDKLVESDFLVREKSKKDKRSYSLYLTEKGQLIFNRSYELFDEWDDKILKNITMEDKELLFKILKEVVKSTELREN